MRQIMQIVQFIKFYKLVKYRSRMDVALWCKWIGRMGLGWIYGWGEVQSTYGDFILKFPKSIDFKWLKQLYCAHCFVMSLNSQSRLALRFLKRDWGRSYVSWYLLIISHCPDIKRHSKTMSLHIWWAVRIHPPGWAWIHASFSRLSLDPCICPRCRSDITGRATDMEQFLRS